MIRFVFSLIRLGLMAIGFVILILLFFAFIAWLMAI